jgi:hypothetical protein
MLGTVERLYGGNPRFIDRAADFTAARLIAGLKGVPTFDDDERTRIALEVAQGLPEDGQRVLFRHIDRAFRPAT